MKTLVFAEKPSVARDIGKILQATTHRDGYLAGQKYIVTWGIGHLVSIAEPEEQNPVWKKWSMENLPMIPNPWKLTVLSATKKQFEIVSSLMSGNEISEIINAADAGREGELIFRLIYEMSGCRKPFKRLWISSMTDEAIKEGFTNLKPGNEFDNLGAAALCRARSDWLVGMNLTRCYTKKLGTIFTVGRVQTPTLAMVVKRHLEIANFKPRDYWEITADLGDFKAVWFDPSEKEAPSRISEPEKAKHISDKLTGAQAEISKVTTSKKKLPPPLLYDLTTLQREANSRFGFTAAQTLSLAQALYESRKIITYPRTDSRHLSNDIYKTIPRRLAALPPEYDGFRKSLPIDKLPKPTRVFDDKQVSDHHAIIPTEQKVTNLNALKPDEKKIYDLIARRFLAAFYPDHEYLATTVVAIAVGESLKAQGRVVLAPGWRVLTEKKTDTSEADDRKPEDGEDEQTLPELKKGDKRTIKSAELQAKKTKPPPAHTEASLLQSMETAGKFVDDDELRQALKDCGIGTPATRAEIIEKLIRVGYMVRDKKKLTPTPKGMQLVSVAAPQLSSPEMTGQWEKRLTEISKGKGESTKFMADISEFTKEIVKTVKFARIPIQPQSGFVQSKPNAVQMKPGSVQPKPDLVQPKPAPIPPRPTFGTCPACGKGNIIEGNRGFGCDRFREGCSYVVWKVFLGKKLTQANIDQLIAGKPTRVLKGFKTDDGRTVSGKIRMREDRKGIELVEWDASPGK